MFNKIIFLVFFIIISSQNGSARDVQGTLSPLTSYIEKYRARFETPGLSVVIVKDGKIIFAKGFGTLSCDETTPVDEHTVFQLASVTKNFTATLIMRLADKGVLSLDDKIIKYLPDFKLPTETLTQEVTIRDILSHALGLGDFAGDTLWHGGLSQKEVLENFKYLKVGKKFRTEYGYSNIAFGVVGLIIEKATGKPYSDVLKEELFTPLHMDESSVGIEGVEPKLSWIQKILGFFSFSKPLNIAKPHDLKDGKAYTIPFYDEFYLFPGSSGVNSTALDMGKWLLFQLNRGKVDGNPLISEKMMEEMQKHHVDGTDELLGQMFPKERVKHAYTGLGCFVYDYNGITTIKQMGGIGGARALVTYIPSENLGIAILSNIGGTRASLFPEGITHKFLDLYYKLDEIDWAERIYEKRQKIRTKLKLDLDMMRLKNPLPSGKPEAYVGKYHNKIYGDAEIKEENKNLFLYYRGGKAPLSHLNGDHFTCRGHELAVGYSMDDTAFVEFGRDQSGKAFGFIVSLMDEGDSPVFQRVKESK